MPEAQHHNIDFVLIATATTPAVAIQGTKAGQSPASNAPGFTKSLATSAAKAAFCVVCYYHTIVFGTVQERLYSCCSIASRSFSGAFFSKRET